MTHSPELVEKLRGYAQEAKPYIEAGGGIIGHLEIALSKAAYAAADEEREACASLVHDRLGADGYGVAQMIRARGNPST